MQNEILYIAGNEVDIIPNTINRNLQINDLGSAEDRQSNYSNTVKLPITAKNKQVMNFLGVAGSNSRTPYTQLHCRYIVDGIPLIVNGYAEVKSTSEYYEVVIYDGIIDFAEKIKGKTVSDLSYTDLNHFLSPSVFENSLTNTSGYVYALGDFYGGYGIKLERQIPSVYVHTLWDKIFKEVGVNYFGSFFTDNEDFKTEVFVPPIGYEVEDINPTITAVGTYITDMVSHTEFSDDYIFNADEIFNRSNGSSDGTFGTGLDGIITFNTTTSIELDISCTYNSNSGYNTFQVNYNGRSIRNIHLDPLNQDFTETLNISVEPGDTLQFSIRGTDTAYQQDPETTTNEPEPFAGETVEKKYNVDYNANATINFSEVTGGFLVDFTTMMGDTAQLSFVKDVMQRYGLVLKPIKGSNDYTFIQFEDLLNDRVGSEDWTTKLVGVTKESYGVKYARNNTATYKYNEEIKVPTHDGVLSIVNDNAEADKTLFNSPYEIPITKKGYQGEKLYYHPTWEEVDNDGIITIEPKETKPRVMRINKVNKTISGSYFNDANSMTYTGDVPFLSLVNMGMQYFINVYYKAYGLAINSYKEVDMSLEISNIDVYELDFFKLKYFKQLGKHFYLNKLTYKSGAKVSKATLIEISDFSVNAPVEILGSYTTTTSYSSGRTIPITYLTTSASPAYYDPEFDAPYSVKFLDGSGADVKLYQDGVEIVAGQEILVADWNVTLTDIGNTTDAHSYSWTYQIADAGTESYGSAIGTLNVNVSAYTNTAPIADAGTDSTFNINTADASPNYLVSVDGSGSTDNTGSIVTYDWVMLSKPISTNAVFTNSDNTTPGASLNVPNENASEGDYTFELTVTDNFGATATDTVIITVFDTGGLG